MNALCERVSGFVQQVVRSSQVPPARRSRSSSEASHTSPIGTGQTGAMSMQGWGVNAQDTANDSDSVSSTSDASRRRRVLSGRRNARGMMHATGCESDRRLVA